MRARKSVASIAVPIAFVMGPLLAESPDEAIMRAIKRFMTKAPLATAAIASVAFLAFAPLANATTYTFDVTTTSGTVVDLTITTSNADSVLTPGYDIASVTGTVGGVSVSTYSGLWGGNGDHVSSGLYLDPYLNQNPSHNDGNGVNVFTVQNPPGSGGANFEIDNIYYPGSSTSNFSYQGGIALLLSNGASYYISANNSCSPNGAGCGDGQYYDFLGRPAAFPTPLPSTWTMLIAGLASLGFLACRGTKKGYAAFAAS